LKIIYTLCPCFLWRNNMKSWIHEISESYVEKRRPARKDLLEHYRKLDEHQKFDLMKYNMMVYLDEQVRNAYGVSLEELNEEQLDEFFGKLASMWAGVRQAGGRQLGRLVQGARNIGADYQTGRAEHEKWQAEKLATSAAKRRNRARELEGLGAEPEEVPEVGAAPRTGAAGYRMGITQAARERGLGKGKKIEGDIGGGFVGTGDGSKEESEKTPEEEKKVEDTVSGSEDTKSPSDTRYRFSIGDSETPVSVGGPETGRTGKGSATVGSSGASASVHPLKKEEEPENTHFELGVKMPTPRLPIGSVKLGSDGETESTGGKTISVAARDAGYIPEPSNTIRRRRNEDKTIKIAGKDV
jgi:hypothetical protein